MATTDPYVLESEPDVPNPQRLVPAVSAAGMRGIDRVVVEEVGVSVLMMMGHAGRSLADPLRGYDCRAAVLAGSGIDGGGLCAARHLLNAGVDAGPSSAPTPTG